jgi:hypothetical protein
LKPRKSLDVASFLLSVSLVDKSSGGLGNFSVLRTSPRLRSKIQSGDKNSISGLDNPQEKLSLRNKDTRDFVKYKNGSKNYGLSRVSHGMEKEDQRRGTNMDLGNYTLDNLTALRNEHVSSKNNMINKCNYRDFGSGLVSSP